VGREYPLSASSPTATATFWPSSVAPPADDGIAATGSKAAGRAEHGSGEDAQCEAADADPRELNSMADNINGFYGIYLTGKTGGQGFAMVVLRNGVVTGVDVSGVKKLNIRSSLRLICSLKCYRLLWVLRESASGGEQGKTKNTSIRLKRDRLTQRKATGSFSVCYSDRAES
jgi:hypothetical protein